MGEKLEWVDSFYSENDEVATAGNSMKLLARRWNGGRWNCFSRWEPHCKTCEPGKEREAAIAAAKAEAEAIVESLGGRIEWSDEIAAHNAGR